MICHFDKRGEKLKQKVFSLSTVMNQFEGFVNPCDFCWIEKEAFEIVEDLLQPNNPIIIHVDIMKLLISCKSFETGNPQDPENIDL